MSVPNGNLSWPQFALRDHSLALAVNAPLRVIIVHAVTEEKCAGGHLAQILVEDQDLLPRLHHPRLLLQLLLDHLVLFAPKPAKNAVELAKPMESLVNVDASKIELEFVERG